MSLLLAILLAGCAGSPEPQPEPAPTAPPPPPENPLIVMAKTDLAAARALQAEWLVLETAVAPLPVSLGDILEHAKKAQDRGDVVLANRLAARVSRLSRLGLLQATEQLEAAPYYPH